MNDLWTEEGSCPDRRRLAPGEGGEVLARRPAGLGSLPEPGARTAIAWPEGSAFAFRDATQRA